MHIEAFYDHVTGTISYVLADTMTGKVAIIDPVLDFEPKSATLSSANCDQIITYIHKQGWQVQWILETHAHADHLSGAQYIRHHLGGKVAIGRKIIDVQQVFSSVYSLEPDFRADGNQFDYLFDDGESFKIGQLDVIALHVPGHTPADMAYLTGDDIFVGDTIFMPDVGTARADFPGGDARTLYRSIRKILDMPGHTRIHVCHDYPPVGRKPSWTCTVSEQRKGNIHVRDGISEQEFVAMRNARDATLGMPTLIIPSIQFNIRAGRLPPANNGKPLMQIPINAFQNKNNIPQGIES